MAAQDNNGKRPDNNVKPRWSNVPTIGVDGTNNVIEPQDTKKNTGWGHLEKPTRNNINWILNLVWQWLEYYDLTKPFAVRCSDTPDADIHISGGHIMLDAQNHTDVADTSITVTFPSSNPRIDYVVISKNSGVLSTVQGTEAASPVPPTLSTTNVPLASIALDPSDTVITNDMITQINISFLDLIRTSSDSHVGLIEVASVLEHLGLASTDKACVPGRLPIATFGQLGLAQPADNAVTIALTATDKYVVPGFLPISSETQQGLIEIATQAEHNALTDLTRVVVPGKIPISSETQQGLVERGTETETRTGTDPNRFASILHIKEQYAKNICTLKRTSDQSIPDSTFTYVVWQAAESDPQSLLNLELDDEAAFVPDWATYVKATAQVAFAPNATGERHATFIERTSIGDFSIFGRPYVFLPAVQTSGEYTCVNISSGWMKKSSSNPVGIKLRVWQNSGGALDVEGVVTSQQTWISVEWK